MLSSSQGHYKVWFAFSTYAHTVADMKQNAVSIVCSIIIRQYNMKNPQKVRQNLIKYFRPKSKERFLISCETRNLFAETTGFTQEASRVRIFNSGKHERTFLPSEAFVPKFYNSMVFCFSVVPPGFLIMNHIVSQDSIRSMMYDLSRKISSLSQPL